MHSFSITVILYSCCCRSPYAIDYAPTHAGEACKISSQKTRATSCFTTTILIALVFLASQINNIKLCRGLCSYRHSNIIRGVYRIPCADCNITYVGQTARMLHTRKENLQALTNAEPHLSALAENALEEHHSIAWSGVKILNSNPKLRQQDVRGGITL